MLRNAKRLGIFACVLAGAAGCAEPDVHFESAVIADPVYAVMVDLDAGDVVLRGADVSAVSVDARIQGDANHLGYLLEDGYLTIFDDRHQDEGVVDLNVLVPESLPLELHTGSGDIRLERTRGALFVRTGSGDIEGSRLYSPDVDIDTGSGDVALDLTGDLSWLRVETGSGDVRLDVPTGAYELRVSTSSGDRNVRGVDDVAGAARSIEVHTGSGDIVIAGR